MNSSSRKYPRRTQSSRIKKEETHSTNKLCSFYVFRDSIYISAWSLKDETERASQALLEKSLKHQAYLARDRKDILLF